MAVIHTTDVSEFLKLTRDGNGILPVRTRSGDQGLNHSVCILFGGSVRGRFRKTEVDWRSVYLLRSVLVG